MLTEARYGIIILAAGNSSRLGQPKQLLSYQHTTLLRKVVEESLKIPEAVVAVITGAWQETVEKEIAGKHLLICHNPDWSTGMASSIKTGVTGITGAYPALEAVLLTVCDQPFLDTGILALLIATHGGSKKGIVAAAYNDTLGTPVLFSRRYFSALMELRGQEGAKKLILQHPEDTGTIDFPAGSIDIDTGEDYRNLLHLKPDQ